MRVFFKNLFQLILHPAHGWEDVDRERADARSSALYGLFPLIILAGLTVFLDPVYHSGTDWIRMVMEFVATVTMYFPAYFLGTFVLILFLGPMLYEPLDENRCRTFALYTIGLEALVTILMNCFPFIYAILYFLPVYIAIIQWKGLDYMRVRADMAGRFMMLAVLGVMMPPYLIYFIFSLIIK